MSLSFKLLRLKANLTLEEVARATGVTRGYLSKVERGLVKPSVGSALRFARALNVAVEDLFGDQQENETVIITRAGEASPQPGMKGAPRLVAGSRGGQKMIAFVIRPGLAQERNHPMSHHEGEEILYVLDGRVSLKLPNRTEILERGDCVQFNGAVPHRLDASEDEGAEVLVVIRTE